jgi:hypothetical protein
VSVIFRGRTVQAAPPTTEWISLMETTLAARGRMYQCASTCVPNSYQGTVSAVGTILPPEVTSVSRRSCDRGSRDAPVAATDVAVSAVNAPVFGVVVPIAQGMAQVQPSKSDAFRLATAALELVVITPKAAVPVTVSELENVTAPEAVSVVKVPAAAVLTPSSVQMVVPSDFFCTSL